MRLHRVALSTLAILAGACVTIFRGVKVDSVAPGTGTVVGTRSRAHLLDGSPVVFPSGFRVEGSRVPANGAPATRYYLRLDQGEAVAGVPLGSIAGMESYTGTER